MPRVLQKGSKRFVADSVKRSGEALQVVNTLGRNHSAWGHHGTNYNLEVVKGKHETGLVLKRYKPAIDQSKTAGLEYTLFNKWRKKGYPVPPTTRRVRYNGKDYVAVIDLRKLGDMQAKAFIQNIDIKKRVDFSFGLMSDLDRLVGKTERESVLRFIEQFAKQIIKEEGISTRDCWEIVIDTKRKKARALLLDVTGLCQVPKK